MVFSVHDPGLTECASHVHALHMPDYERLHVLLPEPAAQTIRDAVARTPGLTKTAAVLRAIEVYRQLVDLNGEGVEFLTRRPGGRAERLHLL